MSITRFWQIVAQHKHNPLSHNFAIVRWPNLIVTQNYTSRTEIDDERNPTQGKGTRPQRIGAQNSISPSTIKLRHSGTQFQNCSMAKYPCYLKLHILKKKVDDERKSTQEMAN